MYSGKRQDPIDFWRISEAVFQPELSRIFSDDFCRKVQAVDMNPQEKIRAISGRNTTSISHRDFRCFPAEYDDFPAGSCGIRLPKSSTWGITISSFKIYTWF